MLYADYAKKPRITQKRKVVSVIPACRQAGAKILPVRQSPDGSRCLAGGCSLRYTEHFNRFSVNFVKLI